MAAPITWAFVDQPIASPTVLFDMNNGTTTRINKPGPQTPTPQLNRSFTSNAMGDGGVLSSASYQNRELKFTVWLNGASLSAKTAQLDALKAQLAKPSNLIMYVPPGWSFPVFFRTFRSDDYTVDNRGGVGGAEWYVNCDVVAEPFAIGTRHDVTSGLVVTNDPASGTNKTFFDITGVRGDSPAPALARVAVGTGSPTFFWSQRTANNPSALTVFVQAESGTLGTDTTTQANDANMSGSSNNFTRTTFAANSAMVTRLTVTVPTSSDPAALRGRYRVFAKIRMSATGSNFTGRFVQNPGLTNATNGQMFSWDSVAAITMLDLGIVEFGGPGVTPASIGYSGLSAAYATQQLGIQFGRNSGTATLDLDFVYLMPADERSAQFKRATWAASSYMVIDSPQELAYGMASGTSLFGSTRTIDNAGGLTTYVGGYPMLVPGVTNRWYTLIGGQAASATSTWDVSYWPRWREVATS